MGNKGKKRRRSKEKMNWGIRGDKGRRERNSENLKNNR